MFNKSRIDGAFELLRELTAEQARISNAILCIADLLDNGIDVRIIIIKNEDEEALKKPFRFAEDDELPDDEDDEETEDDELDEDDEEAYYGRR